MRLGRQKAPHRGGTKRRNAENADGENDRRGLSSIGGAVGRRRNIQSAEGNFDGEMASGGIEQAAHL